MATLFKRLQIRDPRPYRPQQPLSIHGHKEFELQTSPLGLRTFSIPLPNRLLPRQSKWSCQCFVTIPSAKCWGKRYPLLQKRQDPIPLAVLVGQIIWSFGQLESIFLSSSDLHMRNNCLSLTKPVLELSPKRNSPWQSLHCQYQRHKTTTLWVAGKQEGSKAFQRLCRPSRGLERR